MILEIEVVINHELERVFFGYANGIQVLYPQTLVELIEKKLRRAVEQYEKPNELHSDKKQVTGPFSPFPERKRHFMIQLIPF